MKNKRKGFTLVELCIVLALTAIVVTMVATFMTVYQSNTYSLSKNSSTMREINDIKRTVRQWIQQYDNSAEYYITANGNTIEAKNKSTDEFYQIKFEENEIVTKENEVEVSTQKLNNISNVIFSFDKIENKSGQKVDNYNVLRCRVCYEQSSQDLLFAIFSTTTRSRFSPADR